MTEQLSEFGFGTGEFGTAATWSVGAKAVTVIFDHAAEDVGLGLAGVTSRNPRALAIEADLPTVAVGQTLTIGAIAYVIRDVRPDGSGLVLLELQTP